MWQGVDNYGLTKKVKKMETREWVKKCKPCY